MMEFKELKPFPRDGLFMYGVSIHASKWYQVCILEKTEPGLRFHSF